MIAKIEDMIVEEVNQPKISDLDLRILSYGFAMLCIEDYKNPEVQKKYAKWQEQQKQKELRLCQEEN